MLITANFLRIHEAVRPFIAPLIALWKRIVVAARPFRKSPPAELVGIVFGVPIVAPGFHGYTCSNTRRASRQAVTKAALDASMGTLCKTAAAHFAFALM